MGPLCVRVERGETVTITRHGEMIAHVIPARAGERTDHKQIVVCFRRRYINAYSKDAKPFHWKYSKPSSRIRHGKTSSKTVY